MAAYPSFALLEDSAVEMLDGREVVRASNGAPKLRELYPTEKRAWLLEHLLTDADRDTLEAHLAAHRAASFDFTWDGDTFTVLYGAPAREVQWTQFGWRVRVRLVQA